MKVAKMMRQFFHTFCEALPRQIAPRLWKQNEAAEGMNTIGPETQGFRAVSEWRAQEDLNPISAASGDAHKGADNTAETTQSTADSRASDDAGVAAGDTFPQSPEHLPTTKLRPNYAECRTAALPPELARVVKSWPELPEPIRAAISAMVQSATGGKL